MKYHYIVDTVLFIGILLCIYTAHQSFKRSFEFQLEQAGLKYEIEASFKRDILHMSELMQLRVLYYELKQKARPLVNFTAPHADPEIIFRSVEEKRKR